MRFPNYKGYTIYNQKPPWQVSKFSRTPQGKPAAGHVLVRIDDLGVTTDEEAQIFNTQGKPTFKSHKNAHSILVWYGYML